jgi:hypothetical protein
MTVSMGHVEEDGREVCLQASRQEHEIAVSAGGALSMVCYIRVGATFMRLIGEMRYVPCTLSTSLPIDIPTLAF